MYIRKARIPAFPMFLFDTNVNDIGAGICRVWWKNRPSDEPIARLMSGQEGGIVLNINGVYSTHPSIWDAIKSLLGQLQAA